MASNSRKSILPFQPIRQCIVEIVSITDSNSKFIYDELRSKPRIFLNRLETFRDCLSSVQLDPLAIVAIERK